MTGRERLSIASWCLYDWGNSAYAAIVLSFVFAPYFLEHVAQDEVSGTVLWGGAVTISAIAIALMSPVFGALGDRGGRRKLWLMMFSGVAILATAAMWSVTPTPDSLLLALVLLAVSNAGFELAYVFYNAMLPVVAPPRLLGRVSGWGWGLGYLGSLASMGLVLAVLVRPETPPFGLDALQQEPLRATAPFSAAWFALFVLPLMAFGPRDHPSGDPTGQVVREGLGDLWRTLRSLPGRRSVMFYLIAHMIYIDGVNTLIVFGPLFAAGSFGFGPDEVLLYGISFYAAAGLGSATLGWLDDRFGAKPMVLLSLAVMTAIVGVLSLVHDGALFWGLSMVLAFFLGPVQSVSRSMMARLAPEEQRTQLFGLYALAGRATAPLGPALLSASVAAAGDQRAGAVVIAALMATGFVLLLPVREPKGSENVEAVVARESADG